MQKLPESVLLLLGTAAAVSGSVLRPRACAADNCFRAVYATQFSSRGSIDCASYWRTTYTPPTVTVTSTETISSTVTEYPSVIGTETIHLTSTTTVPSTLTINVPTSFTQTLTMGVNCFKRQEPANTIPAYAALCSGAVRYSSACSCVGVTTIATITAEAPITVVTVSDTTTVTEDQPITVATVEFLTTDATATSVTIDQTTTVYTGPTETVTQFALQIASGPPAYVGQWLKRKQYTGDQLSLQITPDATQAERVNLHPNGRLSVDANFWPYILYSGAAPYSVNSFIFMPSQNFPYGGAAITCSLGQWDRSLNCLSFQNYNTFGIAYGNLLWAQNAGQLGEFGGMAVTLKAVPHV
ncbi:hypothetical protein TWF696_007017 [Orbilia brochopaga]|uniref:Uncharacterized protein n=1 Tax=Orbilia brochopaga TaxID=3140254 RepID=A0AAV9UQL2_9PEZI